MQPFGTYPIHIIVKGGRTTLLGVVDNESDKTVAGMRAREVSGVFGVENELIISTEVMRDRRGLANCEIFRALRIANADSDDGTRANPRSVYGFCVCVVGIRNRAPTVGKE